MRSLYIHDESQITKSNQKEVKKEEKKSAEKKTKNNLDEFGNENEDFEDTSDEEGELDISVEMDSNQIGMINQEYSYIRVFNGEKIQYKNTLDLSFLFDLNPFLLKYLIHLLHH